MHPRGCSGALATALLAAGSGEWCIMNTGQPQAHRAQEDEAMTLENVALMAQAVEENWCAAWASLGAVAATPRTQVDRFPEYLRVYTPGMPELLLNIVLRYRAHGPVDASAVERIIAPYRRHGLPFQWWLTLGTEPEGLRWQLRQLGMQSWGGATSMTLPLGSWQARYTPAEAGLQLGAISTHSEALDVLRVICDVFFMSPQPMTRWTFENPAFHLYAARLGGRTIAALATLWHECVVGVYHVATLPGWRRRGIAGNLLVHALREARDAGCTLATLTATDEARHLYEQLGFRACGTLEQWFPGPELASELRAARGLSTSPGSGW
jgi:GNAT superfamily N-acetyltransferase